jgi:hypothetical protein
VPFLVKADSRPARLLCCLRRKIAVLIEFRRLRLPPTCRDIFGGDGDRLEAGFCEGERRGRLQGVREEPPLELNPVFGGAFAGLEFVQGGFGAVHEDFVVED